MDLNDVWNNILSQSCYFSTINTFMIWKKENPAHFYPPFMQRCTKSSSVHVLCVTMALAWVVPMANCAAVQPSLSASRWSSLILASCLRPSSLFTRSFSHWYPFTRSKMERSIDKATSRESHTGPGFQRDTNPTGGKTRQIKLTFIAALEHSGTPSLYFPVINPQASGDQVIAPTPGRLG